MTKILVIDDSAFFRKFIRESLEELGFEVEDLLPVSPLDVTEKMKGWAPDLVLTDFNMPHVDGQQVARMARRANPKVPVVVLTATRDEAMDRNLAKAGVTLILHKPMTGVAIVKALQDLLAR
jgi:two-component system chemotaxis response regulator CheY